jgi:hypothetical protein
VPSTVSRENRLILASGALALVRTGARAFTAAPDWVAVAVLVGVGVVLPRAVTRPLNDD